MHSSADLIQSPPQANFRRQPELQLKAAPRNFRKQTTFAVATLLGTILTACGSPNDVPTVGTLPNRTATATAPASTTATATDTVPTPTLVPTDQSTTATPEASTTPTASATPGASAEASATAEAGNPAALVIANEFGVPVAQVEAYHAQGIGYGILAQFYAIANNRCGAQASYTVAQLIALKQGGLGMGEIRKQALGAASASECSLGRIKQNDLADADAQEAASQPNDDKGGNQTANDDKGKPDD